LLDPGEQDLGALGLLALIAATVLHVHLLWCRMGPGSGWWR
jgi:hypothetical protein